MSSEFKRLLKLDVSDLETAESRWKKLSDQLERSRDAHRHRVTGPLHEEWQGEAAKSALDTMEKHESQLGIATQQAMLIQTTLGTAAQELAAARSDLRRAVRAAEDDGFEVTDDGVINPPAGGPSQYGGSLDGHRDAMNRALKRAQDANDQAVADLGRLESQVLTSPGGWQDTAIDANEVSRHAGVRVSDIPLNDLEGENSRWWAGLSDEKKELYLAAYPGIIGGMRGLPSDARDEANRTVLDKELEELHSKNPRESLETEGNAYLKRRRNLLALKDALDEADGGPERKQPYLLMLDPEDDGKAAVALGNPDRADHTAVLVPGTDTTLGSAPGQLSRIDRLHDAATREAAPNERVSTVWWLGYDAPEWEGGKKWDNGGVSTEDRANEGAPDLRRFVGGLRESHHGSPTHMTVIGHSYGSTTVGVAASGDGGLGADDIVGVGSPGMHVNEAEDLNIDPEHVWIGNSRNDEIVDGFSDFNLGDNPAEEPFGGNNFYVDPKGGHSDYWNEDSKALENQGRIIAGERPRTVPKDDNDWPLLPD
ncbi:alpha/beta hydrolase [Streptomyces sp. NPDC058773]|uniref:alpha/beta hydrolase n=1 Tax=Streptomyces sp. NPDC058773 TaxID=3346632 RepID=UPI0036BEC7EE